MQRREITLIEATEEELLAYSKNFVFKPEKFDPHKKLGRFR